MAAFRIGQRVRVRDADFHPYLNGREATVTGVGATLLDWYDIRVDDIRSSHPSGEYLAAAHHLEPIQYDGNCVIEWSECLWQPENIGEPA